MKDYDPQIFLNYQRSRAARRGSAVTAYLPDDRPIVALRATLTQHPERPAGFASGGFDNETPALGAFRSCSDAGLFAPRKVTTDAGANRGGGNRAAVPADFPSAFSRCHRRLADVDRGARNGPGVSLIFESLALAAIVGLMVATVILAWEAM